MSERAGATRMLTCSGWNCAVKKGLVLCMMPSFVPSFAFLKSGCQSEGRCDTSMAKPWFCGVMKACLVTRLMTGWFWPRLPKGIL